MTRKCFVAFIFLLAGVVFGLAQAELEEFPPGATLMVWTLSGSELATPQTLRLSVEGLPNGRFRVQLSIEAEGAPDELGMLGFLGSAVYVQSAGANLDLAALLTLIRRRDLLQVGEEYALPGGILFRVQRTEDIAGVTCLVGEYTPPDAPTTRVELGFALSDPVYFLPRLRVVKGEEVTFEMELVEYSRP